MADTKMKMLRILDIMKKTDEGHPITANEIGQRLLEYGIEAERKSICRDIHTLQDAGYDILLCKDNRLGYYLGSHDFEDWELKILIDAVCGAKFLTNSTSNELAAKLRALSSTAGEKTLEHSAPVINRRKSNYKATRFNIDKLLRAIQRQRLISFQYMFTDTDLVKKPRYNGKIYHFSPYRLVWHGDFYYVIGNSEGHDNLSSYRVDRIGNMKELEEMGRPAKEVVGANANDRINDYVSTSLYNYGGEKIHLEIEFEPRRLDDIIDYFGSEIQVTMHDGKCRTRLDAYDSDGLYFWLLQYGYNVKVISPENVKKKLLEKVVKIKAMYQDE